MPRTAVEIYRKLGYYSLLKKNSGPCSSLHPSDNAPHESRKNKKEPSANLRSLVHLSWRWIQTVPSQPASQLQSNWRPKKTKTTVQSCRCNSI
jgi:hypothetical protein